jgi:Nitrous oxidase accessory protein
MNSHVAIAALSCIILIIFGVHYVTPVNAQSQIDITIDEQGTINPSTAPITQKGNTYVLTGDFNGTITIKKDNIVLDGNNHTLTVPSIFAGGISLDKVSRVIVKNFAIKGGSFGILVHGSSNTIANNIITDADNGFYALSYPTEAIGLMGIQNKVTDNYLCDNRVGINFFGNMPDECSNNYIIGNTLTDCSIALLMGDSENNRIYCNNFIGNKEILQDNGYSGRGTVPINIWDDGSSFGNFWGDYTTRYPNATKIGTSNVGDTPYLIRPSGYVDPDGLSRAEAKEYWTKINSLYGKNVDHYPLMAPFANPHYVEMTTPPKIQLLSPRPQVYDIPNIPLNLTVDKPTSWIGYSLDENTNTTISGNKTLTNIPNGFHTVTVYTNDTLGNMSSETIDFTVSAPEAFPTVTATAILAALSVSIGAGLVVYYKKWRR